MERRGATAPQTAPQTPLARAALVATVLLARRPADPVHQRQPTAARALGHVTAHSTLHCQTVLATATTPELQG